jgi:outer membrane receptor protein involved in Fe transport
VPREYGPDKTENYELGLKGDFIDHKLSIDGSVYYVDWKDIQLSVYDPENFQSYNANASRAKSQGVELSVESRPITGLTVSAWVDFADAVLTAGFPANDYSYGASGNRLPYSSRFSGNLSLDEEFPLSGRATGFVGGGVSYVGNREGVFTSPPPAVPPRQFYPAYAKTDLRGGVKYDSWTLNAFVTNVTDKRGVLTGGLGTDFANALYYIQPRTVGISLAKAF